MLLFLSNDVFFFRHLVLQAMQTTVVFQASGCEAAEKKMFSLGVHGRRSNDSSLCFCFFFSRFRAAKRCCLKVSGYEGAAKTIILGLLTGKANKDCCCFFLVWLQ